MRSYPEIPNIWEFQNTMDSYRSWPPSTYPRYFDALVSGVGRMADVTPSAGLGRDLVDTVSEAILGAGKPA